MKEGQGLVFYSIMTHVYAQHHQRTELRYKKHSCLRYLPQRDIETNDTHAKSYAPEVHSGNENVLP